MPKPSWPPDGRIACVVLGCRRTAAEDRHPGATQIICGKCYRTADKRLRRRFRRLERILRKLGVEHWHDAKPGSRSRRALGLHYRIFQQIVASAIERKVGIAA